MADNEVLRGTDEQVARMLADDPSAVTIVMGLAQTVEALSKEGWDQPPHLASLDRLGVEVDEHGALAAIMTSELEMPPWAFDSGDAAAFTLHLLADVLREHEGMFSEALEGRDIFGFLFVFESYRLDGDAADQYEAQDKITTMRDWPGRREIRSGMAVDRAGYRYCATHFRDTGEVEVVVDQTGKMFGGRIMDGLAEMATALPV